MFTLIFDFDGTIADSFETNLRVINRLSKEYGFRKVTKSEVRNKEMMQIVKEVKIPLLKIPTILEHTLVELGKEHLKPIKDMPFILKKLKTKYGLGIITANTKENAERFLKAHDLQIFDFVHSAVPFSKHKSIDKVIKDFNLLHCAYIGDETRDIEAARKSRIKSVAVTWGYNSKKLLLSHNPDYLINTPKDLLNLEF